MTAPLRTQDVHRDVRQDAADVRLPVTPDTSRALAPRRGALALGGSSAVLGPVTLAGALLVLGVVEWSVAASVPGAPRLTVGLFALCAWVYGGAGIVTWARRPANFVGPLLVIGSITLLVAGLVNLPQPLPAALGRVVGSVPLALAIHPLLAFPSGRLGGWPARATVAVSYAMSLLLEVPRYAFGPPSPLQVADAPAVAQAALWAQRALAVVVLVATVVVLAQRLAEATPAHRRVLVPLYAYGIVAAPLTSVAAWVYSSSEPVLKFQVQVALLAGVPVALLVAMLVGGFERTGAVGGLSTWLSAPWPDHAALVRGLAGTIGDRDVRLFYWAAAVGPYVDEQGTRVDPPGPRGDRGVVELDLEEGRPVGAIVYDPSTVGERALVEQAGAVLALAIDRERLAADLRASEEDLRASRVRIAIAADAERRRIARATCTTGSRRGWCSWRWPPTTHGPTRPGWPTCAAVSTRRSASCARSSTASCRQA